MIQSITKSLLLPTHSSLLTVISYNASKMQASSTNNGRDSIGRRLGYLLS